MSKITFFIPYPEIGPVVEEVFSEQGDDGWELETVLAKFVREIAAWKNINTDVCIARGVMAAALKRLTTGVPVVELPVSGYEILRAIWECQKKYSPTKIAIVGSRDMIYGVKKIQDIIGIELIVDEIHDEDEAESHIQVIKKSGVTVIIGGVMSTSIAQRHGLHAELIQIGQEAIYHALLEAKRVALVRRQEQERGEQFRVILDYSTEGVVTTTADGIINLINTAAAKLTGVSDTAVGQQVARFFPQLGLNRILKSGQAELGEIETMNGQQMAVNRVPISIGNLIVGAVATFQPVTAIQELEGKIRRKVYERGHKAKLTFHDILGNSPAIKRAITVAKEFSEVNSTVLIMGETGTGKEIFAQSIHNSSGRRKEPFVAVNCAALPENLLESELFGYAEGAFTGAVRGGKIGLFELAHMGTIFLDEIPEISHKLQGRLLRVLQEREIMRLGDDKIIPVNVRVIAATNQDLYKMMQEGLFREDLYYRVEILKLVLPSLRGRREDIIPLMYHFLEEYCGQFGKKFRPLSPEAQRLLEDYQWPGNVRELSNIAERLAVLSGNGTIEPGDIEGMFSHPPTDGDAVSEKRLISASSSVDMNRSILLKALEESNYHYAKAAAKLGISRTTLWRRLKGYDSFK
jgi:transcriptional regulator, propionate catabolism operon regulatory protein